MTECETTLSIDDVQRLGFVMDAIAAAEKRAAAKRNPPQEVR
jgi:hypothetical protein